MKRERREILTWLLIALRPNRASKNPDKFDGCWKLCAYIRLHVTLASTHDLQIVPFFIDFIFIPYAFNHSICRQWIMKIDDERKMWQNFSYFDSNQSFNDKKLWQWNEVENFISFFSYSSHSIWFELVVNIMNVLTKHEKLCFGLMKATCTE